MRVPICTPSAPSTNAAAIDRPSQTPPAAMMGTSTCSAMSGSSTIVDAPVGAGVDGLVVEGNEGGGFKAPTGASTMVLLPLIASRVEVPIIAAGGICDGRSLAAALVLGAEGAQMGTRMVSAAESPVHDNWKRLICTSAEGDTLLLNRHAPPAFRVLRTQFSEAAEQEDRAVIPSLQAVHDLYFGGNMEASFAFSGQVAGRIDTVRPVAEILRETIDECEDALRATAGRYARVP